MRSDRPIVVGAGPSGLAAALALRSLGAEPLVLESASREDVVPGSRALFVHGESLTLLESSSPGLGARIAEAGTLWRRRTTRYRGRTVFTQEHPPFSSGRLPMYTSLRQRDTVALMREACELAGVEIRWGTAVDDVQSAPDGAHVRAGGQDFAASHVIAADGARSKVRKALGIELRGPRVDAYHVVVDIRQQDGERDRAQERLLHYRCPRAGGRTVLRIPFAGGFQIDLQCAREDNAEQMASPEGALTWLAGLMPDVNADRVLWAAAYRFNQAVADRFADEHRRVLLIGEAAHLFPPFGARGMNSGIADADEAAIAVARDLRAAPHAVRQGTPVDQYAERRRAAALANSAASGSAFRHLHPQSFAMTARQEAAAWASTALPQCGRWLERAAYGPRTPTLHGRY